jgi:hypothetical protein
MIDHIHSFIFPATFALLPTAMNTPEAHAMLLAIGLQESDSFRARRQYGNGPARGFWQFERGGGVTGVLGHPSTSEAAAAVCTALVYKPKVTICYTAIEHNDVLACCFARLLLWTLPERLPMRDQPDRGWAQYLKAWRPGKPHPDEWPQNFATAWAVVQP